VYVPAQHDEVATRRRARVRVRAAAGPLVTGLVTSVDEQLTALRSAAFGLAEAQARAVWGPT